MCMHILFISSCIHGRYACLYAFHVYPHTRTHLGIQSWTGAYTNTYSIYWNSLRPRTWMRLRLYRVFICMCLHLTFIRFENYGAKTSAPRLLFHRLFPISFDFASSQSVEMQIQKSNDLKSKFLFLYWMKV